MARPRKPTAQLELVGAFKKNPQRSRGNEPVSNEDVLLPPFPLDDDAMEAWEFLVAHSAPGVLTGMDSAFLAITARCLGAVWKGDVNVTDSAKVGAMLGKLGMTPSERSRVVVPKKETPSVFAAYKRR